jgi:hypothetical protein
LEAAREVVPDQFLAVMLSVEGEAPADAAAAALHSAKASRRSAESSGPLDVIGYRRLYDLVAGN